MARSRNIKPAIMANEELAELPFQARLLFIYTWMLADREGRLDDRPKRIGAQALPYDREVNVDELLTLLQRRGFIERYEVDGSKYIQINGFTKHQMPHHKEVESIIPPPDGMPAVTRHAYSVPADQRSRIFDRDGHACLRCSCSESLTIDHIVPLSKGGDNSDENLQTLCHRCNSAKGDATKSYRKGHEVEEEKRTNSSKGQRRTNVGEYCRTDSGFLIPDSLIPDVPQAKPATPARKPKAVKTQMPDDFGVSQRVEAWAKERGFDRLDEHLDAFRRKASAKAYAYANWDDAFMEAIREDWAKLRNQPRPMQTYAQQSADLARMTVPSKPGRDPNLLKIEEDAKNAVPIPASIREKIAALKGGVLQ